MPLKTSDEKQDLILKVFDYFEAESKLNVVFFYLYFIFFLLYLKKIYINYLFFLLCLNNIHKTCFHFLKVYTKHAKHGLFYISGQHT
jgi:hypothetical protein